MQIDLDIYCHHQSSDTVCKIQTFTQAGDNFLILTNQSNIELWALANHILKKHILKKPQMSPVDNPRYI